jgi:hypothetical protein
VSLHPELPIFHLIAIATAVDISELGPNVLHTPVSLDGMTGCMVLMSITSRQHLLCEQLPYHPAACLSARIHMPSTAPRNQPDPRVEVADPREDGLWDKQFGMHLAGLLMDSKKAESPWMPCSSSGSQRLCGTLRLLSARDISQSMLAMGNTAQAIRSHGFVRRSH